MELLLAIWLILIGIVIVIFSSYTSLLYYYSRKPVQNYENKIFPTVSLIMPTYNEEVVLKKKIENTAKLIYPKNKLEIIFLNDHSTDRSVEIIRKEAKKLKFKWKIVNNGNSQGKPNALNYLLPKIKTEITVITDVDSLVKEEAIEVLVQNFQNSRIGGANARISILKPNQKSKSYEEEKNYRNFFDIWRQGESKIHSISVCNGPLMAFRTKLLDNIYLKSEVDDTELAFNLINLGKKVVYDSRSVVYEITPLNLNERSKQKIRRARGLMHVYLDHLSLLGKGKFGWIVLPYALLTHILSPYLVLAGTIIFPIVAIKNPYFLFVLPIAILPKIGKITKSFISTQIIMALSPFLARGWNTAKSSREALAK